MKTIFTLIITVLFFVINPISNQAQCTPGDETTCPDAENNGEVCPAILPNGIIDMEYNQEFTIIAPPEYEWEEQIIPLHHLKIVDVTSLPPGITWQTNAADSIFMVGTYYCVLLSGTSEEVGNYPLKIVVDVYISILGTPVYATQVVDSTSISMKVTWDPDGIESYKENEMTINVWPNPFQDEIAFSLTDNGNKAVTVEIYSMLGSLLVNEDYATNIPNESYHINCSNLPQGTYLLKVSSGKKMASRLIRKTL